MPYPLILLAFLLAHSTASISSSLDANFESYNDSSSYTLNLNIWKIAINKTSNSDYDYSQLEFTDSYNLADYKITSFVRLAEHSSQQDEHEQSFSIGTDYKSCNFSIGSRQDILGTALLIRPECRFKYSLDNYSIEHKYAYIYTKLSNYFSAKVKIFITDKVYLSLQHKSFHGIDNASYDWKLNTVSFGIEF